MEDYRCWSKHGEEGLNEAEMWDSYLEREVPIGVEEEHDDVNEANILGLTDDIIEFQVYNIEQMVSNVERHGDNDQYSNVKLTKYKKMIKDSKEVILSWLWGSVHETVCDGEAFIVEGEHQMEWW
jgi:hypothetical protein